MERPIQDDLGAASLESITYGLDHHFSAVQRNAVSFRHLDASQPSLSVGRAARSSGNCRLNDAWVAERQELRWLMGRKRPTRGAVASGPSMNPLITVGTLRGSLGIPAWRGIAHRIASRLPCSLNIGSKNGYHPHQLCRPADGSDAMKKQAGWQGVQSK